ncbi:MAG: aminopeptidase P family N-terminal domain-containing protein, partial [Candidatus Limnocylindria bacterium]
MTIASSARLAEIALPEFVMGDPAPILPEQVYLSRLERLRAGMEERGLDRLLIYADREHSANLAWL